MSLFEFSGASSSPSLSRKGSLNLDRFNFSLSSADERYSISHGATGGSKIPVTSEVRSENQSLLGAVEPLDWLFSADSEPEPPSSPKWVNKSLNSLLKCSDISPQCFRGPVTRTYWLHYKAFIDIYRYPDNR